MSDAAAAGRVMLDKDALYGPYLRFSRYDVGSKKWYGSVLLVAHESGLTDAPALKLSDKTNAAAVIEYKTELIDTYSGWRFWRTDIAVDCGASERTIQYSVVLPQGCLLKHKDVPFSFVVPSATQTWRIGFYSCNGFHEAKAEIESGGIQPLWRDVMAVHGQSPLHLMLGGGDQLYNDPVWECLALKQWCAQPHEHERLKAPYSPEMDQQVSDFYLHSYMRHWCQPVFSDALASVPQVMVWDDHDIWDGWGSYPERLQNCNVFKGVYASARRFYALFQQHTTPDRAVKDNGVFGTQGWNWLSCVGPSTAVLVLDSRAERTEEVVLTKESWDMVKSRLSALPETVRHIIVTATVPTIYPKVPYMESALSCLNCGFGTVFGCGTLRMTGAQLMQKTGLADSLMSQFGTVEILDDLMDHWGSDVHMDERNAMIHMMQEFSQTRGWRFSLVSGDVHLAAVAQYSSSDTKAPQSDHRYIPQIISSAIGNVPPPPGVVATLTKFAASRNMDADTVEIMRNDVFDGQVLCPKRNWLLITQDGSAQLQMQYHVEQAAGAPVKTYTVAVPALEGVAPSAGTSAGAGPDGAMLAAIPSLRLPAVAA